jgi:hypothetical protein
MIVIASIHQPATSTYLLFDQVLLLSEGKTVYLGSPASSQQYFDSLGYPHDPFLSPPEHMLQLVNTDFRSGDDGKIRLNRLIESWEASSERRYLMDAIEHGEQNNDVATLSGTVRKGYPRVFPMQVWIQLHRMFLVLPPAKPHNPLCHVFVLLTRDRKRFAMSLLMAFELQCTSVSQF